jgi:hypothetical protein
MPMRGSSATPSPSRDPASGLKTRRYVRNARRYVRNVRRYGRDVRRYVRREPARHSVPLPQATRSRITDAPPLGRRCIRLCGTVGRSGMIELIHEV